MAPTQLLLHPLSAAAPATQPLSRPESATVDDGETVFDVETQLDGPPPGPTDATQLLHPASPAAAATRPLSPHESATDGGATVGEAAGLEDATQLLRPPLRATPARAANTRPHGSMWLPRPQPLVK